MSMKNVEREVLKEAKEVFCNPRLKRKDILGWALSEAPVEKSTQDGQVMVAISIVAWVRIAKEHDKRKPGKDGE